MWDIVNSEAGKKNQNYNKNISLKEIRNVITNLTIISNMFNNYFVNIVKDDTSNFSSDENQFADIGMETNMLEQSLDLNLLS